MTIFIGADHRGFELKNKIMEYLQEKNIRVEDMGAYEYDKNDDYVDFSNKVAQAVLQHPDEFRGIVVCGSGIGVTIAANRHKGIRCALGFREDQIQHGRTNDHINVLALPSDYLDVETAKRYVDTFLATEPILKPNYERRNQRLDE